MLLICEKPNKKLHNILSFKIIIKEIDVNSD